MGASNSSEEAGKAAAARRQLASSPHSGETVSVELTAERKENIRLQDEIWGLRLLISQLEARLQAVLTRLRQIQAEHKEALDIHADQSRAQQIQIAQLIQAERIKSQKFQDELINAQQIQAEQEKALQIQAKQIEQMKARLVEEQIPQFIQAEKITAQQIQAKEKKEPQIQAEQIETKIIQFERKAQLIQAEQIKTLQIQVEQKNALQIQAQQIITQEAQIEQMKAQLIQAEQTKTQQIQIAQLIQAEQIKSRKFQDELINAQQIQAEQEKALQIQAKQIEQMKARLVEEQIPQFIQAEKITAQQIQAKEKKELQIQAEQIETKIIQFERKAQLIQAEQIKTLQIQVEQKNALQIQAQQIITQEAQIEQMKAQLIQAEQTKTQLIRDVQIPREHLCPNVRLGCTIPVLNHELLAHGKACLYRLYQCPMKSCSWQGNYSKLYCHAEEAHTRHTGIHFGQKYRLLVGENMMLDGMLLRHEELVFKLNARPTQPPLAMCWALQLLCPPAEAANWRYQIQIIKMGDEVKRLHMSDACLHEDDNADDILNEGRCPSAAFIMLNNFQLKRRISFKVNIYKESQLEQPVSVCVEE